MHDRRIFIMTYCLPLDTVTSADFLYHRYQSVNCIPSSHCAMLLSGPGAGDAHDLFLSRRLLRKISFCFNVIIVKISERYAGVLKRMVTINLPAAVIFLMGYYWPVTLLFAVAGVACIFCHTRKKRWRVTGIIVAAIVMLPAVWLWWVFLTS